MFLPRASLKMKRPSVQASAGNVCRGFSVLQASKASAQASTEASKRPGRRGKWFISFASLVGCFWNFLLASLGFAWLLYGYLLSNFLMIGGWGSLSWLLLARRPKKMGDGRWEMAGQPN